MTSTNIKYQTVIGLEVHIQLNTHSKAFSSERNQFETEPNINISPITLALPGTLPRVNKGHVEKSLRLALALGCSIPQQMNFDRKNYFYPDLPKGYQITQDKNPIGKGGSWTFLTNGQSRTIQIHHIHMEEDAGKSNHDQHSLYSTIEYNRAGTPLIELVTEPQFVSGQEVYDFLTSLQQLVQYLEISDGNMEEGSLRCDCNVSVMPEGSPILGERCEIKNVNSRRFAREAITYEAGRQQALIGNGVAITRTTLLYDTTKGITVPMRKKEGENDYRYFPEPDLSPINLNKVWIDEIRQSMGILPNEALAQLISKGVSKEDAEKICQQKLWFEYFLRLTEEKQLPANILAIILVNKVLPYAESNQRDATLLISDEDLADLIDMYNGGKVGKSQILSVLLPALLEQTDVNVWDLASKYKLIIDQNEDLLSGYIDEVLSQNPDKVNEYLKGKSGLIGFFMGQIKQKSATALDAALLKSQLETALEKLRIKN